MEKESEERASEKGQRRTTEAGRGEGMYDSNTRLLPRALPKQKVVQPGSSPKVTTLGREAPHPKSCPENLKTTKHTKSNFNPEHP